MTFYKYNGKSIIDFFNWPKRFKKKFRIEIRTFSFQICFQNQLSTSGSFQTENTQIRMFAYFPFDHFPKQILKEKVNIFILFFLRVSVNILKSKKKMISNLIFKKWFDWGTISFFGKQKFLKKPNVPKCA